MYCFNLDHTSETHIPILSYPLHMRMGLISWGLLSPTWVSSSESFVCGTETVRHQHLMTHDTGSESDMKGQTGINRQVIQKLH